MRTAATLDRIVGFKEASPEKRVLTKEQPSSSLAQTTGGKSGHKKRHHHEKVNLENESPVKKHLSTHCGGGQDNNENALSTSSAKKLGKENGAALGIRRRKNERAQAAIASAQKKGNASLSAQSETVDTFNPVNEIGEEDKSEKEIELKEEELILKEEFKVN